MAKQTINIGTGELTGDGESIRSALDKINDNFDELYTQDGSDVVLSAINASLIPDTDVTYDLGSATNRFRDLYLSGSTIDLGGTTLSVVGGQLQIGGTDIADVIFASGKTLNFTGTTVTGFEPGQIDGDVTFGFNTTEVINFNSRPTFNDGAVIDTLLDASNITTSAIKSDDGENITISSTLTGGGGTGNHVIYDHDATDGYRQRLYNLVDFTNATVTGFDTNTIATSSGNLSITADNYVIIDSDNNGQIEIGRASGVGHIIIGNTSNGTDVDIEGKLSILGGGVPASSLGASGDSQGLFVVDGNYIYYCTDNYDGVTNIWKRVAWSGDTW